MGRVLWYICIYVIYMGYTGLFIENALALVLVHRNSIIHFTDKITS